jgi:beta-1,4-mannosyl-glycoprotein beta-1,4-N-acetylglucosaminyltransferase
MKIYDCIMFNGEHDVLEVRLNELDPLVDHFFICESLEPHGAAGTRKYQKFDQSLVQDFKDKITYIALNYLEPAYTDAKSGWARENFHRNALFQHLLKLTNPVIGPEDIILNCDADEIPRPQAVVAVAETAPDDQVVYFDMLMYYYNVNNQVNCAWRRANMGKFKVYQKLGGFQAPRGILDMPLTSGTPIVVVKNGGWHFSYFSGVDGVLDKVRSFAHSSDAASKKIAEKTGREIAEMISSRADPFHEGVKFVYAPCTDLRLPTSVTQRRQHFAKLTGEYFDTVNNVLPPKTCGTTDAVIGVIRNYDWGNIKPYALSLAQSGFKGEKIMFCKNVSRACQTRLTETGFTVIPYVDSPETDAAEAGSYMVFNVHRFRPVIEFLSKHADKYRNILWCDVRDVVFQSNPGHFMKSKLTGPIRILAASEGFRISENMEYNDRWLAAAAPEAYKELRNNEVCCDGTIAADASMMLRLFERIYERAIVAGNDQGVFNYLIRKPYAHVTRIPSQTEGFISTWFPEKTAERAPNLPDSYGGIPVFDETSGVVYTPDGRTKFAVVHQFDRSPRWSKIFQEKFA